MTFCFYGAWGRVFRRTDGLMLVNTTTLFKEFVLKHFGAQEIILRLKSNCRAFKDISSMIQPLARYDVITLPHNRANCSWLIGPTQGESVVCKSFRINILKILQRVHVNLDSEIWSIKFLSNKVDWSPTCTCINASGLFWSFESCFLGFLRNFQLFLIISFNIRASFIFELVITQLRRAVLDTLWQHANFPLRTYFKCISWLLAASQLRISGQI